MPFTSHQINQMISGQQAMFANQAAMAHNVGVQAGLGQLSGMMPVTPPSFGGEGYGGQEVFPGIGTMSPGGYGASMVGSARTVLPGAMTGLGIAGGLGLLGHAGGYLDPFTGVGRAFMGGVGSAGGLSAGGLGAVGRGLAYAAPAAAAYLAGAQGIAHVGTQIAQGAQNINQVSSMAGQFFGPAYGEVGVRPGGQAARGQIQAVTSVLQEVAGEETMASMRDLLSIMDKVGRSGLLQGIGSPEQFRDRFRKIVSQSKQIAEMLGTTIEEGAEALTGMQRMGLWSSRDIMGTTLAMRQVGPQGRGALMGAMRRGSQVSHAMGGSLAAGANLARDQFLNIQAAVREGILPQEAIQEFTGGVGGVEGQQIAAERVTSAIQSMAQSSMGQLAMAGLAEVRGGRFTGRIDQSKLENFQRGGISIGELQRMGMDATRTRTGAASFSFRQEQLGQQLLSEGGLELVQGMFQQGLRRAGLEGEGEEVQGIMLQKMFGMDRRDAMLMQQLLRELPKLRDRRSKREIDALQDALRQGDERRNRSLSGLRDAIRQRYEQTLERPLQELGEQLTTGANETFDRVTDTILGRTRQIGMSRQDMIRAATNSALSGRGMAESMERYTQSAAESLFGSTSIAQRMRSRDVGIFEGLGASAMSLFGMETGAGTRAEVLALMGAPVRSVGAFSDFRAQGLVSVNRTLGGAQGIPVAAALQTAQAIQRRAMGQTAEQAFGVGKEGNQATTTAYQKVRSTYRRLLSDAKFRKELRENKETMSPAKYANWLSSKLREIGKGDYEAAIRTLRESQGPGASDMSVAMDAIAAAQVEEDNVTTGLEIDFGAIAEDSGSRLVGALQDGARFSEEVGKESKRALDLIKGAYEISRPGARGLTRITTEYSREVNFTSTQFQDLVLSGGSVGEEFREFLASGGSDLSSFPNLLRAAGGNKNLGRLIEAVGEMSPSQREKLTESIGSISMLRGAKARVSLISERGAAAAGELQSLGGRGSEGLRSVLSSLARAGTSSGAESLGLFEEARKAAFAEAQRIATMKKGGLGEIKRLRKTGGAVAEHIADLATLARLNSNALSGKTGQEVESILGRLGLGDDLEQALTTLPRGQALELEKILSSEGKLSRKQASSLKEILKKFEASSGLLEGERQREEAQVALSNALRSFTEANTKFVLAVSEAVPNLSKVTGDQVAERARRISAGGDTGGVTSGR